MVKIIKKAKKQVPNEKPNIKQTSKIIQDKISTGIRNMDKITEGGFRKKSANLVVGESGSGKSIMATQFLMEGINHGENVLYISFSEKKEDFYSNMSELGWDLQKLENQKKFFFLSYTSEKIKDMLEEGGGDIETVTLTKKIKRIALDSITDFVMLFDRGIEMREKTLSLFALFKSWDCTSLFTYEENPLAEQKTFSEILESEVDSISILYSIRTKSKRERLIEIYKMRGTNHSKEIFQYAIEKKMGIIVSPSPFKGKIERN